VITFLEGQVARFCLPEDVIFVDALPLGATGKVQKTLLRQRYGA
jgi:acyl-CoA synthetase (AMP-forming)/AMP-acid ligase II